MVAPCLFPALISSGFYGKQGVFLPQRRKEGMPKDCKAVEACLIKNKCNKIFKKKLSINTFKINPV